MQNSEPAYLQNYLEDTEEKKMKNRNSCFPEPSGCSRGFCIFSGGRQKSENQALTYILYAG